MSKNVITMIKKELTRFFTDRRMLFSLILPGLLIYVLYSFMGNITSRMIEVDEDYEYQVYMVQEPQELEGLRLNENYDISLKTETLTKDEWMKKLENKELDLVILYEAEFYNKMLNYTVGSGDAPMVEIYYNSTKNESSELYNYYVGSLSYMESQLSNKFDINRSTDVKYDLASEDDMSIQMITALLPFLLLTFLFSGAMSVASESIAGEKERGTFATLLITPTKKSEIALGKIISLSIITLVSAASSFTGLMLSLPKLMSGSDFSISMYGFGTYALLFTVIISTVLIYVVLLALVSAYAKSIKEAGALAVPLMILNMLVGISSMIGPSTAKTVLYLIPVYNSVQSIISILSLEVNMMNLAITIATNFVFVAVGVVLLTKMFNSERIMFNK
ncbi:MAG: ABC transporter permease [Acholeplasma sp.]|nr:ABC transporter permease [Acholeplasma sp.]